MENVDPNTFKLAVFILAIVIGIICGLIPLITGFIKKRTKLGVIGFISSVIGGAILGLLLALPVAIIFTVIIFLKKEENNALTPSSPDIEN